MIRIWQHVLAALLFAAWTGGVAGEPEAAAPAVQLSAVETLLFETDHLVGLSLPAKLEYRFSWDGNQAFEDRVVLTVSRARLVDVDYLSGGHHVNYPPVPDAHGNPLLLYFLEHDLREMSRQTHGQSAYFRRLIRRAMARPDIELQATEVVFGGRKMVAQRIVIEPFRADPMAPQRYPALVGKSYEFIVASEAPGQIVSLASHVPSASGKTDTARVVLTGAGSI